MYFNKFSNKRHLKLNNFLFNYKFYVFKNNNFYFYISNTKLLSNSRITNTLFKKHHVTTQLISSEWKYKNQFSDFFIKKINYFNYSNFFFFIQKSALKENFLNLKFWKS